MPFKPFITFAKSSILDLAGFDTVVSVVSASSYEIWLFTCKNFSLILLVNKSEYMVKIDNDISVDFTKTRILVLLRKSSMYSSR